MNFRGNGSALEKANAAGIHQLIHNLLEEGDVLGFVNDVLAAHNHQSVEYGQFRSGLHLHFLVHALDQQWEVYFRTEDGKTHKAETVQRYVDSIGRQSKALIFDVKENDFTGNSKLR